MSMARRVFPSRLELNRPDGSSSEAPFANVTFTWFLYVSPVQIMPSRYQTGTPRHFHSSTTSGTACLMSSRTLASVSPRQSPSSWILASMRRDGDPPLLDVALTTRPPICSGSPYRWPWRLLGFAHGGEVDQAQHPLRRLRVQPWLLHRRDRAGRRPRARLDSVLR